VKGGDATHVKLLLLNLPGYSVRGRHKAAIAAVMHPQTLGLGLLPNRKYRISFVVENRVLRRMVMTGVSEAIRLCTLAQSKGQPGEGILEWLIYIAEMRNTQC
jgi:hypothetical protein